MGTPKRSQDRQRDLDRLTAALSRLHVRIRRQVRSVLLAEQAEDLARVSHRGEGDVSFRIDVPAEETVLSFFSRARAIQPVVVVSEGIGRVVFPKGAGEEEASWIVIIDPLDGSRELMYDKRSAWILTAVAPNRREGVTLADVVFSLQTEVPPSRQRLAVTARAIRGGGAYERSWDLDLEKPVGRNRRLQTSGSHSIRGGFATFVHYFAGSHKVIGQVADRVFRRVLGPVSPDSAATFDDQYISSGGQLYLLASGRYRFVADLRPELAYAPGGKRRSIGLCAHPYDLCTAMIAEEAGAVVTDGFGSLHYPLDTSTACTWVGYANRFIREEMEPTVQDEISRLRSPRQSRSAHSS
jgi:fructose-1,6-bisphosphatase/inositol monophosphatase family enzyme